MTWNPPVSEKKTSMDNQYGWILDHGNFRLAKYGEVTRLSTRCRWKVLAQPTTCFHCNRHILDYPGMKCLECLDPTHPPRKTNMCYTKKSCSMRRTIYNMINLWDFMVMLFFFVGDPFESLPPCHAKLTTKLRRGPRQGPMHGGCVGRAKAGLWCF